MSDFTPTEVEHFKPGTLVAKRYRVEEVLGWGAMGLVVSAIDTALNDEPIALKILYSQYGNDRETMARFRREVILSRKLSHPNIVRVYDFGDLDSQNGAAFLTMEFVKGETLRDKLDRGIINSNDALRFLKQIAAGLEHAHSQQIVHRDLKPENILITEDGTVKITDFGVAKSLISDEKLTKTDEAVGSPVYISPESITSGSSDHRVDIYALGIISFEMLEGRPPFYSKNWVALAKMHMHTKLPEFINKNVPEIYRKITERCCEKDPDSRFLKAEDILKAIENRPSGNQFNSISIFVILFLMIISEALLLALIFTGVIKLC